MFKTIESFIEVSRLDEKIIRGVLKQLDNDWDYFKEIANDVVNYGADSGYSGFIYYCDTVGFVEKHKKVIEKILKILADDLGENFLNMISAFKCMNNMTIDKIAEGWYDKESENRQSVFNCIAFFVLEEVCRDYVDYNDDEDNY